MWSVVKRTAISGLFGNAADHLGEAAFRDFCFWISRWRESNLMEDMYVKSVVIPTPAMVWSCCWANVSCMKAWSDAGKQQILNNVRRRCWNFLLSIRSIYTCGKVRPCSGSRTIVPIIGLFRVYWYCYTSRFVSMSAYARTGKGHQHEVLLH